MTAIAFRGELLSVGRDPAVDADAVRHECDGLLVVEDGIVVARGAYADLAPRFRDLPTETLPGLIVPGLADTPELARSESEALIARWRGRGRLGYAVTPRFALTSSDAQLHAAGALLDAHPEVLLHTHLAENLAECAAVAGRFPECLDYLDAYDRFGLVAKRSVFAHGIHLSPRACAHMAQTGAGIAVCPSSNLFLGPGFFDFGQAADHRVKLGLGSDIGAGTSLSMLHTAGLAYQAAQARGHALDPFRALYLATAGGAALLHIEDRVGALEPGQEADFIVLDPAATPLLARRTRGAGLAERLFALQILGDDRAIAATYLMGTRAWP